MLRHAFGLVAGKVAPRWLNRYRQAVSLRRELMLFRDKCDAIADLSELVRWVTRPGAAWSMQKEQEILQLLRLVEETSPRVVCEIGAAWGGSLLLFSRVAHPQATIISIDIGYTSARRGAYPCLVRRGQKLHCLPLDSHAPATIRTVKNILRGRQIDFLFVDGDHTLSGVSADYQNYGQIVRDGGMIAFHDIVPDSRLRNGAPTAAYVGEVPQFWAAVKHRVKKTAEFVENKDQDGYGIGVLWHERNG